MALQSGMTHGRLLLGPPHSWSWRDRSDTNISGYLSRWGGRRFKTTVQRWVLGRPNTIFGSWHTFSGYLQQQIGDNQWDKICILGWKGRRAFGQEAGAEPGRVATSPTPLYESFVQKLVFIIGALKQHPGLVGTTF